MSAREEPAPERCTVEPSGEEIGAVAALPADQPLVMLNLLRFREVADYSAHPELAPANPISGESAYRRYGAAATPHITAAGATVDYAGAASTTVIGPADEQWDQVLLVRYPSPAAFIAMVTAPDYVALSGHRTAALLDSRLIPTALDSRLVPAADPT